MKNDQHIKLRNRNTKIRYNFLNFFMQIKNNEKSNNNIVNINVIENNNNLM